MLGIKMSEYDNQIIHLPNKLKIHFLNKKYLDMNINSMLSVRNVQLEQFLQKFIVIVLPDGASTLQESHGKKGVIGQRRQALKFILIFSRTGLTF